MKHVVEVLTAYSHTPERLDDLRKALDIARAQGPNEPDDTRNEAASRPHLWAMSERLSHEDTQTIIDLYRAGTTGKDLAAKFGISLSSVRRLLRKHGARLSDHEARVSGRSGRVLRGSETAEWRTLTGRQTVTLGCRSL